MRSFCIAKASLIFSTKNISLFGYEVVKHLTSWPLNELVKLMIEQLGPDAFVCLCLLMGIQGLMSKDVWDNYEQTVPTLYPGSYLILCLACELQNASHWNYFSIDSTLGIIFYPVFWFTTVCDSALHFVEFFSVQCIPWNSWLEQAVQMRNINIVI